jgi:hypothetical protein
MQNNKGVFQRRWIVPDPGVAEQLFEPVFLVNALITFQNPAPQGLTKPPGT